MANHELMLGLNHDLSLSRNQLFTLGHNHNLGLGHNHAVGLGKTHHHELDLERSHEEELALALTHDHELDLERSHEEELALAQTHDHEVDEIALQHAHNHKDEHEIMFGENHSHKHDENELVLRQDLNHGQEDDLMFGQNLNYVTGDHGQVDDEHVHEMSLTLHNQELPENDKLVVVEGHEFDQNLDLMADQNKEMCIESSGDIVIQQHDFVIQAREDAHNPNHELTVGKEFPDVKSCRRALRDAAIALHFEIQTVKSDKTRFTAKCASEGCPWRIHVAKLPGVPTFTIRTINDSHTCGGITHVGHQQASVQWVANSVEQRLKENPHYKPKEILEEIHRVHGITLSYKQAWRGKERIMAAVRGSFEEGYRLLPLYCDQLKNTNPGSIASVYGNPNDNGFQRLFISFQASIFGFVNACRPIIGLDRTPLMSKYLGTLLFATGFDGDGALFPLAFGVVEEENDDNWMWFLSELHNLLDINIGNMPRLTILSDRQIGIVEGVEANFPTAFHGFCMRHLIDSFRKEFNNTMLVNLLWEAAHALTVIDFEAKVVDIEDFSQDAADWIRRVPPRLWAMAYFEGTRFGHLTANIVESLNSWILEASGLPIVQMMECIRRQLMTWFNERRESSMQWTTILVPSAERHVLDAVQRAKGYQVHRANDAEYDVISDEGTNIVNIRTRCCLCRGWQLYGLPCAHAVATLLFCRQNVHRYAESCFTVATYRKTYSQTIHPIPDKNLWIELSDGTENGNATDIIINPPKSLRPPGRPRKKRVRAEDHGREKRVVHCSRCNQTGHFRTTCAAPL